MAVERNDYEVLEYLLKKGANPNIKDINKQIPLMYALKKSHEDLALLLVKYGSKVNIKEHFDDGGMTALIYAIQMYTESKKLIRALIKKGADIDLSDMYGTPLIYIG